MPSYPAPVPPEDARFLELKKVVADAAASRVPVRTTRARSTSACREQAAQGARRLVRRQRAALDGDVRFEAANFVDGKLSVDDIAMFLSAEFDRKVPADVLGHWFDDLVSVGAMGWSNSPAR